MGLVQHRQIRERLVNNYAPHVDMTDIQNGNDEDLLKKQLSRAMAAMCLNFAADTDPVAACAAITDGFNDNGIDAVWFDIDERVLYLVQSKWNEQHTGGIDNASILAFSRGVKDLLNGRFERFNDKFQRRRREIDQAINSALKVSLIIGYSGSAAFPEMCRESMEDLANDIDDTRDIISYSIVSQHMLHGRILLGAQGAAISAPLTLLHWGQTEVPFRAYYGQVAASDLVDIHLKFGHKIFSKNIRMFLGQESSVNRGICSTVEANPELFWFFNNGVTVLANRIRRRPAGGVARDAGTFDCDGLSVVNGAQTVGSLSTLNPSHRIQLEQAKVLVRLISLENTPDGFSSSITRNNNTQNRIDSRNFVSLDPEQERIRAEFSIDNIDYEYRQGEIEQNSPNRLDLVEATIALACTDNDVSLPVIAKREIGKLWEDITRAPYRRIFHAGRTSDEIWRRVTAFRRTDSAIQGLQIAVGGREHNIAVHGNRFLVYLIYRSLVSEGANDALANISDADIQARTRRMTDAVSTSIANLYPDSYLASLFKNQAKCQNISEDILR